MRQAITTKFAGPTDTQGSRVIARCQAKRLIVPWGDELSVEKNHELAAELLAESLGWLDGWHLVGGALPDGTGYCFVLVQGVTP